MRRRGIGNMMGQPSGGGAFSFGYLNTVGNATNAVSYTFSSVALGEADASRRIFVGIFGRTTGTGGVSSVTIGGVSASLHAQGTSSVTGDTTTAIFSAPVPSGTTGDVVVTFNSGQVRSAIALWRYVGETPSLVDSGSGDVSDITITTASSGFVIGVSAGAVDLGKEEFSVLTVDGLTLVESGFKLCAASDLTTGSNITDGTNVEYGSFTMASFTES
jgi:hypothetical protein